MSESMEPGSRFSKIADEDCLIDHSSWPVFVKFNDVAVYSNLHVPPDDPKYGWKFYYATIEEAKNWTECARSNDELLKAESSLYTLMAMFPSKKIYLRYFPSDDGDMFFAQEVFEVILVILIHRQPEKYSDAARDELMKCESDDRFTEVMTESEMERLFEKYGANKGIVTLVPDVHYDYIVNDHFSGNVNPVFLLDSESHEMMNSHQAIYAIFNTCVCGLDWDMTEHSVGLESYLAEVRKFMEEYEKMDMKKLVHQDDVLKEISVVKSHYYYRILEAQSKSKPNCNFWKNADGIIGADGISTIGHDQFDEVAVAYSLLKFTILQKDGEKEKSLPIFRAVLMCQIGWIQKVFGDTAELKFSIFESLKYTIPQSLWTNYFCKLRKAFTRYTEEASKPIQNDQAGTVEEMKEPEQPHTDDNYEKLRAKSELRQQQLRDRKKNKKAGIQAKSHSHVVNSARVPASLQPTSPEASSSPNADFGECPGIPASQKRKIQNPKTGEWIPISTLSKAMEEARSLEDPRLEKPENIEDDDDSQSKNSEKDSNDKFLMSSEILDSKEIEPKIQLNCTGHTIDTGTFSNGNMDSEAPTSTGTVCTNVVHQTSEIQKISQEEKSTQFDSESCEQCPNVLEELRIAREKQQLAEAQLEDYKQKAMRTEAVEETLRTMGEKLKDQGTRIGLKNREIDQLKKTHKYELGQKKTEFQQLKRKLDARNTQDNLNSKDFEKEIEDLKKKLGKCQATIKKAEIQLKEEKDKNSVLEGKVNNDLHVGEDIKRILVEQSKNDENGDVSNELCTLKLLNEELADKIENLEKSRISLDEHQSILNEQVIENSELKAEIESLESKHASERERYFSYMKNLERENEKLRSKVHDYTEMKQKADQFEEGMKIMRNLGYTSYFKCHAEVKKLEEENKDLTITIRTLQKLQFEEWRKSQVSSSSEENN